MLLTCTFVVEAQRACQRLRVGGELWQFWLDFLCQMDGYFISEFIVGEGLVILSCNSPLELVVLDDGSKGPCASLPIVGICGELVLNS